ncbi:ABC transporter ATP-binding protein [Pseudoflavonifractor capillosus]|uniref:ABC transporter ATP-binding protein n=1 Tax=Pseudoflavonifractor capillosus TaxID=106588 RepID=UPI00195EC463|nr:ABC transporter ATP-binding protein [Pseudoflavonifractor capillosus]MBM6897679.1 ABC transporter ATP-binding protein [Pseudoflavonifractor capillosus]
MNQTAQYIELKRQFKKLNKKNYSLALVGKLFAVLMSISMSLVFTYVIEAMEEKDLCKFVYSIGFLVLYLMANLLSSLFRRKYQNEYMRKGLTQFKNYVFEKILKQPISCYTNGDTAKFISAFSNDLASIETNYLLGGLVLFVEMMSYIATAIVILVLNLELGAVLLCTSLLAILVSLRFGGKVIHHEVEAMKRASDFVAQTKDFLTGFTVIKSFKAENEILEVFKERNVELESAKQKRRASNDTVSIASNIASILVSAAFLSFGFLLAFQGKISVGKIIGFYELSSNMLSPIRTLGGLITNYRAANELIGRIADQIERTEAEIDYGLEKFEVPKVIQLRNVSFGYSSRAELLSCINAQFELGKSYAIVGSSGSGKSTLLRLLMGFEREYSGEISYGNRELRKLAPEQLWDHMSTIQQEVFCFNDTIYNNITMFRKFTDEQVQDAITRSGLSDLISKKGFEYMCGEGGCFLSGGERQRLSIARCLIRKSPILFVDEADSALDNETASDIMKTILKMNDMLRIVVTHRLDEGVMEMFNQILVLHNGHIEEKGNFSSLMNKKGYFYSLFRTSQ